MYNGTSRIGLATTDNGLDFSRLPQPVFYPEEDFMKPFEWEGGAEDPRIVEDETGTYWLTYTAYDGKTARLCVASSPDLHRWKRHGLAFKAQAFSDLWSKSGAIACKLAGEKMVAVKLQGKYWMYWGDTHLFVATSDNLADWTPVLGDDGLPLPVLSPREGMFDSRLAEPGPPALLTRHGLLLIYNAMNKSGAGADPGLPEGTYTVAQALFSAENPASLIARADTFFMKPEAPYEITGQVGNVCFAEGLAFFKGDWFLYYGTADSKIAVTVCRGCAPL